MNFQLVRKYGLLLFIFLCPIFYVVNTDARLLQENFFQCGAICITALFIGDIWIGAFIILNVMLFIYNGAAVGFGQVLNITFGSLLFMISRSYFKANKFSDIYKPLLLIFGISLFFIGLQYFGLDPLYIAQDGSGKPLSGANHDYSGVFMFKASNGTFSCLIYPILVSISLWLSLVVIVPIILSSSTSVFMAFIAVTLFYTFYLHRRLFVYALGLCIIGIVIFLILFHPKSNDDKKFNSRFSLWHATFKQSLLNPIGYGPDSFRNLNSHKKFKFFSDYDYNLIMANLSGDKLLLSYYSPTSDSKQLDLLDENIRKNGLKNGVFGFWDNPHCEYLKLLFEYGIFGLIILFFFMRGLFIRFILAKKDKEIIVMSSCLLVYFVVGITHFPLELARTAFLFPIVLGAFYSRTDQYVER